MYYPCGGWEDFAGAFDSLDEAREKAKVERWGYDWSQIVDTETMEEVT